MRNQLQWNFNQITIVFIQENEFKNVVCKTMVILFVRQCSCWLWHWSSLIQFRQWLVLWLLQAIISINAELIRSQKANLCGISYDIMLFSFWVNMDKKNVSKWPQKWCRGECVNYEAKYSMWPILNILHDSLLLLLPSLIPSHLYTYSPTPSHRRTPAIHPALRVVPAPVHHPAAAVVVVVRARVPVVVARAQAPVLLPKLVLFLKKLKLRR